MLIGCNLDGNDTPDVAGEVECKVKTIKNTMTGGPTIAVYSNPVDLLFLPFGPDLLLGSLQKWLCMLTS